MNDKYEMPETVTVRLTVKPKLRANLSLLFKQMDETCKLSRNQALIKTLEAGLIKHGIPQT